MNAVNQYFGSLMIILGGNVYFQKIFIASPLPRRARGGGVQKEAIFEGVGGCLQRFFFRGIRIRLVRY